MNGKVRRMIRVDIAPNGDSPTLDQSESSPERLIEVPVTGRILESCQVPFAWSDARTLKVDPSHTLGRLHHLSAPSVTVNWLNRPFVGDRRFHKPRVCRFCHSFV